MSHRWVAWLEDTGGERCSTVVPCHTETSYGDSGFTTITVVPDGQFVLTDGMSFVAHIVFDDGEGGQGRADWQFGG